ncbi:hypothetical protein KY285_000943 [Solanum tuberosum]|nr:hypothetical protein KY285_000943 [Solanum tuberosum]
MELAAAGAHHRCSLRGADVAVIFSPEREATGGAISVLLLLRTDTSWLLANWSCCQRWRFAGGLRAPVGARHCCPTAGFTAAAGRHCSLLVLQAALAEKKDGEEGKRVWAADLEMREGE